MARWRDDTATLVEGTSAVSIVEHRRWAEAGDAYRSSAWVPPVEGPGTKHLAISVIMPCLNEERRISRALCETTKTMSEAFGDDFEVIVVDDGSTDGTSQVVQELSSEVPEVRLLRIPVNGGKGNAERLGFSMARGDLICFLDGDFDIHPKHIMPFLRLLQDDHVSVVIGSKRHPDSQIDYPFQRRLLSAGYGILIRALFGLGVRDTQAGIKVFKRGALDAILPMGLVKRYAFDAELLVLAHRMGFEIAEAPIEMDSWDRIGSGVKLREVVRMFVDTLGIFYRLHITRYYQRTGEPNTPRQAA